MSNDFPLTRLEVDSLPDPAPHNPPAGDWKDDDGRALDSYFEAMDLQPLISYLTKAAANSIKPPTAGRLLRQRFSLTVAGFPYSSTFIFPPDPNRSLLVIQPPLGAALPIYISDGSFTANDILGNTPETPAFHVPGAQQIVIPNYTGAVWAAPAAAAGNIRFDFLSITS